MKILIAAPANNIHTVKIVNELSVNNEIYLVSLPDHCEGNNTINKSVSLIYLKYKSPFGYFINKRAVKKIVEKLSPDIINVHYASGYGTLFNGIRKKNTILNVWGSDIYVFPKKNLFNKMLLKKNLKSYEYISSTSFTMGEETKKYINKNIFITPFGIDLTKYKFSKERKKNVFVVGIVKSLKPVYGFDTLLKAFVKVQEKVDNIELHIFGEGFYRKNIEEFIFKEGIERKVRLWGEIKNDNVPGVLQNIHLLCLPSLSESFGVSALEAMAVGTMVLASDADGFKEIIQNGKDGFIVGKENIEQLADKIVYIYDNYQSLNYIVSNARKKIQDQYELKKTMEQLFEVYKRVNNK